MSDLPNTVEPAGVPAAVGGSVETGSRDGSWVVRVLLPVPAVPLVPADDPARSGATDPAQSTSQEAP